MIMSECTRRRIVDAHHHLWDLSVCRYPWLEEKGVVRFFGDPEPIRKNYLVDDLRSDAGDYELAASVHIQVGVAEEYVLRETEWLQQTADRDGLPSAIVAFCDLASDDVDDHLEQHCRNSRVRGVRQIVGRSAEEDRKTGSDALLENPAWRDGLVALRDRGLSFDLQLIPPQMQRAADVLADVPGLRVALCHCGSPWDQSADGLKRWRAGLEALAGNPDVYCKISGLAMFDHNWTAGRVRPIIETCLEVFGTDRAMFGSNFPVDKLHKSYSEICRTLEDITGDMAAGDCERLFAGTAESFYRL